MRWADVVRFESTSSTNCFMPAVRISFPFKVRTYFETPLVLWHLTSW